MYEEEIHFGKLFLKQFEMAFEHLTPVTLTFDPKINRVHLLSRMDVWTKFEEDRSRCSRVTDQKRKGYKQTDRHVQSNLPSSSKGGIKTGKTKTTNRNTKANELEIQIGELEIQK